MKFSNGTVDNEIITPSHTITLDDKYDLGVDCIFATGVQALVRLSLMQSERDRLSGYHTGGYISGYRGSPLSGIDIQFMSAQRYLLPRHIHFRAGLNEDLAATALWGTQQAEMRGEGAYDGVFGMWYGKGPGVDRCGDVFRHANLAGTSRLGGVLVLMGDDHGAESSTVAHQSDFALIDAMIPILNPSDVQELLDFGILGFALSRWSGCWVGLKCIHDTVESASVIDGSVWRVDITIPSPDEHVVPEDGLNIRPRDDRFIQERRIYRDRLPAVRAFARSNTINRIYRGGSAGFRFGIVASGKTWLDVREALEILDLVDRIDLLKIGMVWPLEETIVCEFARDLDFILVVEEKRGVVEPQLREILYGMAHCPSIIGKKNICGSDLIPAYGTIDSDFVSRIIGRCIDELSDSSGLGFFRAPASGTDPIFLPDCDEDGNETNFPLRTPYFCAGCPHNSSTIVPEGGRAYAGIGCHWMVQFMPDRNTEGTTHMGGEGANWLGESLFSTRSHIFQNLGDGTYSHSGLLAIRAALADGANITYKILYNDAVAMTGGQSLEGNLSPLMIARQISAEGISDIALVSDDIEKYTNIAGFPADVSFHDRSELDDVQKRFMNISGVSVIIYDQTCAAEKRRRRKRGTYPNPARRVYINSLVCEGCGDCGVQSNCVAIAPVETPFGRKRVINQSVCNKDFSCLKGFCPSFVTIEGGHLITKEISPPVLPKDIPAAPAPLIRDVLSILITGVGGTGVVTIGQIIAMAAHIEGRGASLIDMVGLSQKNGAVVTHMRLSENGENISAIRVGKGRTDFLLGCDLVASVAPGILSSLSSSRSDILVNEYEIMPSHFAQDRDFHLPSRRMRKRLEEKSRHSIFTDATHISEILFGDTISANMFLLGSAVQNGFIPLKAESLHSAIRLNGVSVETNIQAFEWGRFSVHDPEAFGEVFSSRLALVGDGEEEDWGDLSLQAHIARREDFLRVYQDEAWSLRYRGLVDHVRSVEEDVMGEAGRLTDCVMRYFFKLMSYKDEYEVARLFTNGEFELSLRRHFHGGRLYFYLSPPFLSSCDPATGRPRKYRFGGWIFPLFRILSYFRFLRGGIFDIFGYGSERRRERALIDDYERLLHYLCTVLSSETYDLIVEMASIPDSIRGFGPVKSESLVEADALRSSLLRRLDEVLHDSPSPLGPMIAAAE